MCTQPDRCFKKSRPLVVSEQKVLIVSGSVPPESCGVGDYSTRLYSLLRERGVDAHLIALRRANLLQTLKLSRKAIVHIQYPSVGYRWSLLPQLLCLLARRSVVTIHEFSQVHFLRKMAELPLLIFARRVIVTTEYERNILDRLTHRKVEVVPVVSAVPLENTASDTQTRDGVVFFGLMRPHKGVEEFLALARKLRAHAPSFPIRAYSSIPAGNESYASRVLCQGRELGIDWQINRPLSEVSTGLLSSKYAYLHFPDGVSDRRSSFVAAVTHGLVVLTSKGDMSSPELDEGVVYVEGPSAAFARILEIEHDPALASKQIDRARALGTRYEPERFTDRHLYIYSTFVKSRKIIN